MTDLGQLYSFNPHLEISHDRCNIPRRTRFIERNESRIDEGTLKNTGGEGPNTFERWEEHLAAGDMMVQEKRRVVICNANCINIIERRSNQINATMQLLHIRWQFGLWLLVSSQILISTFVPQHRTFTNISTILLLDVGWNRWYA